MVSHRRHVLLYTDDQRQRQEGILVRDAKLKPQSDYLDLALTFRLFFLSLLTLFFLHLSLIVNECVGENKILPEARAIYDRTACGGEERMRVTVW